MEKLLYNESPQTKNGLKISPPFYSLALPECSLFNRLQDFILNVEAVI